MPVNLTVTLVVIQALNVGTPMDGRGTINTRTHTHTHTHTHMQMHTHLCIHQDVGSSGLFTIRVIQVHVVTAARNEGGAARETGTTTVLNRRDVLHQEKYVFVWINEEIKLGQYSLGTCT